MRIKKLIGKVVTLSVLFLLFMASMEMNYSYGEIIAQDRRINWNPGVKGGIPSYPVAITATNEPYNADNEGLSDASSAIQNALNACPPGYAVYLPAGMYILESEIHIPNHVVLRGAGSSKTVLKIAGSQEIGIRIGGYTAYGTLLNISSGYTKGSTTLTMSSITGLSIGNVVLIQQQDAPDLVFGTEAYCARDGRHMGQIAEIDSISGNNITIDPALSYTLSSGLDPELLKFQGASSLVESAGVENLFIERLSASGSDNIHLQNCRGCWVKNIESYTAYKVHLEIDACFRCEVRDSYFHHVINNNRGDGGHGYGVRLAMWASDNLIENNIFYELRHSVIMSCAGAGNVIAYNYSEEGWGNNDANQELWMQGDLITHNSHPFMTLWEGNKASQASQDNVHGSASHSTWLRNHLDAKLYNHNVSRKIHSIDIQKNNLYINLVGNVLGLHGDTGSYEIENKTVANTTKAVYKLGYVSDGDYDATGNDANVKTTLLRHGNYDYINGSTQWDPGINDKVIPNSYYLSSKPAFFGDKRWPPFGPDLNPMVVTLPAEERFMLMKIPKLFLEE